MSSSAASYSSSNLRKHTSANPLQQMLLGRFHRRAADLLRVARSSGGAGRPLAVLDAGCGEGISMRALVGAASITFMATGNSTLQLNSAPGMRGRVMALWFVAFQGSTPIGGPIIGAIIALAGARAGLGVGALTCFAAALVGVSALRGAQLPSLGRGLVRRAAATKTS